MSRAVASPSPDNLSVQCILPPVAFQDTTKPDVRTAFKNCIDIPYHSFRQLAVGGIDGVIKFHLAKYKESDTFLLHYETVTLSGSTKPEAQDKYTIDFGKGKVLPGYLRCDRRDRISGRRMLAHRIATGMALGLRQVNLTASADIGAYVWARAGLYVTKQDELPLSRRLLNRLWTLQGPVVDERALATAFKHARLCTPDDLQALAMLDAPVTNAAHLFNKAAQPPDDNDDIWGHLAAKNLVSGDTMPLGKFLLAYDGYDGFIDPQDPIQLGKFSTYTKTDIPALVRHIVPDRKGAKCRIA